MNDGVLTTKDFINMKQNQEATVNVVSSSKKNIKINYIFKLNSAPKGNSQTNIKYRDKLIKIKMVDGVYELKKNWKKAEKEKFSRHLQILGFIDISEIAEKKEEITPEIILYKIVHPEHTNKESVNGEVSVVLEDKEFILECKDSMILTDDKNIYLAFIKKGWTEMVCNPKKDKEVSKVIEIKEVVIKNDDSDLIVNKKIDDEEIITDEKIDDEEIITDEKIDDEEIITDEKIEQLEENEEKNNE